MNIGLLRAKQKAERAGNFDANSYANEMSSSCNVRSLDDSASANAIKEYGFPVAEKQSLSTAEISAPTASGNEDFTCCSLSE